MLENFLIKEWFDYITISSGDKKHHSCNLKCTSVNSTGLGQQNTAVHLTLCAEWDGSVVTSCLTDPNTEHMGIIKNTKEHKQFGVI